jgi:hypothetical protein
MVIGHFDSLEQARVYRAMLVADRAPETILGIKRDGR